MYNITFLTAYCDDNRSDAETKEVSFSPSRTPKAINIMPQEGHRRLDKV